MPANPEPAHICAACLHPQTPTMTATTACGRCGHPFGAATPSPQPALSSAVLHSNAPFSGWSWAAGRLPSGAWQVVGGQPTQERAEQALLQWFTERSAPCVDHPDRLATAVLHEEDDEKVWVPVCAECAEHAV